MKKIAMSLICLGILTSGCFTEKELRQLKVVAVNKCELIKGEDEYFLKSEYPNAYKINVHPDDIEILSGAIIDSIVFTSGNTEFTIYPVADFSVVRISFEGDG
jgi:flagellar basal body rod protein FlgF